MREKLRIYLDHFLPREVIGPVIIVFSLESVVDGIFQLYVPPEFALVGWTMIFAMSIALVAYWGTSESSSEELHERLEEI